ncbi:hypothetical protein B0H13DRAFT_2349207 [Mycena leptocephala]|nr:hypothetical protein B0H13DRAFT_2349207 [Mycena leptocephala]
MPGDSEMYRLVPAEFSGRQLGKIYDPLGLLLLGIPPLSPGAYSYFFVPPCLTDSSLYSAALKHAIISREQSGFVGASSIPISPASLPSFPLLSSLRRKTEEARCPISARRTYHFVGYIVILVHTGTVGVGADRCVFGAIVPVSPASGRANADGRVVLMSRNATRHRSCI